MSQVQYNEGYNAFFATEGKLSLDDLKAQSSFFRKGFRKAQEDSLKNTESAIPTVLYDIPKQPTVFVPQWTDILAATRRPRFAKLHQDHMSPWLNLIIKMVENNSHKVKRYSDVVRFVDEAFDKVLQYGYDEGILNETDLKQYNYIPKK